MTGMEFFQDEISASLGDGVFYFTMLRHPIDLFISFYEYKGNIPIF